MRVKLLRRDPVYNRDRQEEVSEEALPVFPTRQTLVFVQFHKCGKVCWRVTGLQAFAASMEAGGYSYDARNRPAVREPPAHEDP